MVAKATGTGIGKQVMNFIDWLLRNFLRLIIILAIIFVVLSFGLQTCEGDVGKPPSKVDDMAYIVKTDSRNYYTDSYEWQGEVLILHGFWVKEGGKWRQYDRDMKLDPRAYSRGGIKVEKR